MATMSRHHDLAPQPTSDPIRRAEAGAWLIELLPANAYEARYVASQSAVGFAFDSQRGDHAIASDRIRPFDAVPNGLAFVPAGCDVYSRSLHGGEYLRVLRRDEGAFDDEQVFSRVLNRLFNNVIDTPAIRLAGQMRKALLTPSADDDWEAWAMTLAGRISADAPLPLSTRGSLTATRLRLLDEFIDAGLGDAISVQAIASLLGLSEGYFMRAFSEATGSSPHRYLVDRRVARARTLLRDSTLGLADIAHACGFSSQAHLATTFKQRLGVSPGVLRACLR